MYFNVTPVFDAVYVVNKTYIFRPTLDN